MATNRLLECLNRKDRAHLLDRSELVELTFPEVLAEPGDEVPDVYFPTVSFISLVTSSYRRPKTRFAE